MSTIWTASAARFQQPTEDYRHSRPTSRILNFSRPPRSVVFQGSGHRRNPTLLLHPTSPAEIRRKGIPEGPMRDDFPPTQKFVRAIFSIVVTTAVVVATYLLIGHFFSTT